MQETIEMGERLAIACALGGPERRHLLLLSALAHSAGELAGMRNSRIDVLEVEIAGDGQQQRRWSTSVVAPTGRARTRRSSPRAALPESGQW